MTMSLKETQAQFKKLNNSIEDILYRLGNSAENIKYDLDDLDESFMVNQFNRLESKLYDIKRRIDYLSKPVEEQGFLKHNKGGRYELPSGTYFTTGDVCEILVSDEDDEQYWVLTLIEHNGEDYYAKALGRDVSINGRMVRCR